MKVKIWGARGSTPVNGLEFARYSGETACIEVRADSGECILLDAGTGLRAFAAANRLRLEEEASPVICLSHLHLDHVQGLPFYAPIYNREVQIFGPQFPGKGSFAENLGRLFDGVLFPIHLSELKNLVLTGVYPNSCFRIGQMEIEVAPTNHPGGNLAWKIRADGQTLVYTGDHEIPMDDSDPDKTEINSRLIDFLDGCDLAIVDSHFSENDHLRHKGWGHSNFYQWCHALADRKVGRLIFTHFSPEYGDREIESLLTKSREIAPHMEMAAASPGMEADLKKIEVSDLNTRDSLYDFLLRISHLSDIHSVLDSLLKEARRLCHAEAGTIYLRDKDELVFMAAHNDSLFSDSAPNKYAYLNSRLPLDASSIAGYVASTGKSLNISDVNDIPQNAEYSFNDSFDRETGYRSRSMLGVPLINGRGNIIGALQLINAMEGERRTEFEKRDVTLVSRLANLSTLPLEKAFLVVNIITRMLHTSALRDPMETSSHVQRVGSVAAELYHHWAKKKHIPPDHILTNESRLRLAAMLHDIGKVGIPGEILKKPGKLTAEERKIMQTHSALGAALFEDVNNELEEMARDIALYHHARWDGSGYTGDEDIPSPAGEKIPVWARIVAIADVYDALVSKRCYKEAWPSEKALAILQRDAGTHFDPELVECFMEIQDIIANIYQKFDERA